MAPNPSCPIPVVDFSAMSLDVKDPDRSNQAVKDLANQVYQAFSTIGVVYITNYGIPQETASLSFSNFFLIRLFVCWIIFLEETMSLVFVKSLCGSLC